MVFSSLIFTFYFLPIVLLLYFLAKDKYRNYILLGVSLLFYAYGEPRFVFVMFAMILTNYKMALWINKKKEVSANVFARNLLILTIVFNLSILFLYKYLDFSIDILNFFLKTNLPLQNIVLPIGISFFTFQALSYVIDVYRGNAQVQKNPFYLALYISFFPQLIAGPIVRYQTIEQQITQRKCTIEKFGEGGRRFLLGFCKKVILANHLSEVSTVISEGIITQTNPVLLWIGSICYSLQIFYDFSGYSDMAIGLGKIFGFEFEENFNYPYISKTITEFWRRWHISLGQWFRDYVYIPLGGSKMSVPKNLLNLFIVWSLTGIWHGANFNFVAWGLGYFILLAAEKYVIKPDKRKSKVLKIIWQIVTLLSINFGWVIFRAQGIKEGIQYCFAMLGYYKIYELLDSSVIYYFREYGFFMLVGVICVTPVIRKIGDFADRNRRAAYIRDVATPICYGLCFLWAVSYLILGAHNPFIYFNF